MIDKKTYINDITKKLENMVDGIHVIDVTDDGVFTTVQNFQIDGVPYHIINRGPYEVKKIGKIRRWFKRIFVREKK